MNEPAKPIFKSKTALVGGIAALTGALSYFNPTVAVFLRDNAQGIVTALGVAGIILRKITSGRVVLFGD